MKGLLLKDWYMTKKYCRAHFLIAIIFLAVAATDTSNLFFLAYPCIFISTIPTVLLSYDERCKWDEYCGTLPFSKSLIVSEKFVFGLLVTVPLIIITALVQSIALKRAGAFDFGYVIETVSILMLAAAFVTAVTMPFMIKLGVEKGRIAYYVMIGAMTALAITIPDIISADLSKEISIGFAPIAVAASIIIYALSWYLSIGFYKKREI